MGKWDQYAADAAPSKWDQYAVPDTTAAAPSDQTRVGAAPAVNRNRDWLRNGADVLPAAGATIAGALMAPVAAASGPAAPAVEAGSIYGGGVLGENGKQLAYRLLGLPAPQPFSWDALRSLNNSGNEQLMLEAGGRVVRGAARGVGRALMRGAIRPTPALLKEFPDIIDTAIRERIPVGRSDVAVERLRLSAAKMRAMLEDAERRGVRFRPEDIPAGLQEFQRRLASGGRPISDPAALASAVDGFVSQWNEVLNPTQTLPQVAGSGWLASMASPDREGARLSPRAVPEMRTRKVLLGNFLGMTPDEVKGVAQMEQARGREIFRAADRGNYVPEASRFDANVSAGLGTGASDLLHTTIPGTSAQDAQTQSLIGLASALAAREGRNMPILSELGVPMASAWGAATMGAPETAGARGLSAWLAARLAMDPHVTSRSALWLTDPMRGELLRELPRYVWADAKSRLNTPNESDYGKR